MIPGKNSGKLLVLFKDRDEVTDRYADVAASLGFEAFFVPVLQIHHHVERTTTFLETILKSGNNYDFILSSKNAAKCVVTALKSIGKARESALRSYSGTLRIFTLGLKSAGILSSGLDEFLPKHVHKNIEIKGLPVKSATQLANVYIADCWSEDNKDNQVKQVVFLCGKDHRNELPTILREHQVPLVLFETYHALETDPVITSDLQMALRQSISLLALAFFSPRGANLVSASETWRKQLTETVADIHLIAIGETTAKALTAGFSSTSRSESYKKLWIANKPNPEGVAEVLRELLIVNSDAA